MEQITREILMDWMIYLLACIGVLHLIGEYINFMKRQKQKHKKQRQTKLEDGL